MLMSLVLPQFSGARVLKVETKNGEKITDLDQSEYLLERASAFLNENADEYNVNAFFGNPGPGYGNYVVLTHDDEMPSRHTYQEALARGDKDKIETFKRQASQLAWSKRYHGLESFVVQVANPDASNLQFTVKGIDTLG